VGLAPETPFELADRLDAPGARRGRAALVDTAKTNRASGKRSRFASAAQSERKAAAAAGRLPLIHRRRLDFARPTLEIFPREAAWKDVVGHRPESKNWSFSTGPHTRRSGGSGGQSRAAEEL